MPSPISTEVLLYSDIHGYTAESAVAQLDEVKNAPQITLRFCGNGGELKFGWALLTKAAEIKGKKTFKNDGEANSMYAFAFCYNKGINECTDVATFGFHRASFGAWYEGSDLFTNADREELIAKNAKLRQAMEARMNIPVFERIAQCSLDQFFSINGVIEVSLNADQALECGLVDRIVPLTPTIENEIEAHRARLEAQFKPRRIAAKTETTTTMTVEELKSKHPDTYKAIYAKGIARGIEKELDRVGSILAHIDADQKGVIEAVKSGKPLSATQHAEFAIKAVSKTAIRALEEESADPVAVDKGAGLSVKAKSEKATLEAKQKADFEAAMDAGMKKIKKVS